MLRIIDVSQRIMNVNIDDDSWLKCIIHTVGKHGTGGIGFTLNHNSFPPRIIIMCEI